ncbi:heavy-metal-associated domain-containing protein [Variovorax boronicumulans]|uniref:heavy-metal-associated domain-containing protein n=1 Tax=Variovorax boronicumulans TaxID=436515 RepID=UPI001C565F24
MSQKFEVTGMTCGHCASTVKNALQSVDPEAQVTIDLPTGHVDVLSEQPRTDLVAAIENAGYAVK